MSPQRNRKGIFRRPDHSLGWAALESKQAAAIARGLPPLVAVPRRRATVVGTLRLILVWVLAIHMCYLVTTAILIVVYRGVDPPATVLMAYRRWVFGWAIQAPRPLALRKVPRYIRSMLIAAEDGKFHEHHGIDLEAFQRALEINKRLGKPLYGGSTITMQVARTLFLVPEKSYVRKYLEVLTALDLEAFLSKDRILELYFGYAEWGKGLFGIESAARRWYGRGVSTLTRDEAARLIAILSSPIKYGPDTLQRNGILRERYRYLAGRFDPAAPVAPAPVEFPAPPSPEPGVELESPAEAPAPD